MAMSKIRLCRYECGTELGDFDEHENKYREVSGTLHTKERCQSLKNQTPTPTQTKKVEHAESPLPTLTLEMMDIRLKRVENMLFQSNQGT
jgi:hypothetical protein